MRMDLACYHAIIFCYQHEAMCGAGMKHAIDILIGDLRWLADQSAGNGCHCQVQLLHLIGAYLHWAGMIFSSITEFTDCGPSSGKEYFMEKWKKPGLAPEGYRLYLPLN